MEPSEGSVRALTRGLDVLRVISISGGARIAEIAQLAALTLTRS